MEQPNPREQVTNGITADEEFVTRIEQLSEVDRARFALSTFGTELDMARFVSMRLGEHALHTWDIAVALDPKAEVAEDAVELLIDTLPAMAAMVGKPAADASTVTIETVAPQRNFALTTGPDVALAVADTEAAQLRLPAEALVRLAYGRLDPAHAPAELAANPILDELRPVFPGF